MKPRKIREMIRAKEQVQRGQIVPARVWEVRLNKGQNKPRAINPKAFQRAQRAEWDRSIIAARHKMGLSQSRFAQLLGISVRTLHHWEQGTRTPSGPARVLLRVAAMNPKLVLKAAA